MQTVANVCPATKAAVDADAYGRLYADLHDLLQASEWFVSIAKQNEGKVLSTSDLEDLLIKIDVTFVQHVTFHLNSLRRDLKRTLANFPHSEQIAR